MSRNKIVSELLKVYKHLGTATAAIGESPQSLFSLSKTKENEEVNIVDLLNKIVVQNDEIIGNLKELNDPEKNNIDTPWLTPSEAAAYSGFNTNYFRQIINKEIPFFQRGRKIMIEKADLEAWMQKNKVEPI